MWHHGEGGVGVGKGGGWEGGGRWRGKTDVDDVENTAKNDEEEDVKDNEDKLSTMTTTLKNKTQKNPHLSTLQLPALMNKQSTHTTLTLTLIQKQYYVEVLNLKMAEGGMCDFSLFHPPLPKELIK